jgi:SRSO17 transposase
LLAAWPRKSIEPMVLAVQGVVPKAVRAMPSVISEGRWDEERLRHRHWQEVEMALGTDDGVLMGDGRDCPKQGCHAAGVTRQYGGELGTRANGQAGVLVGVVSAQGYTLLERRLYLPRAWRTDDADAARRRPCAIPPAMTVKTKPALAAELRAAVVQSQSRRCRWVVADEAFGCDPDVLDGVARLGLWYWAEVPHTTRVWDVRPAPRGVVASDDQRRQPGPPGRGVCCVSGDRRTRRLARSGRLVGAAAASRHGGVAD